MISFKNIFLTSALALAVLACGQANAASKADLDREADQALQLLIRGNSLANDIAKRSVAVLVFPNIVKAGLIFGGAYGEGVLKQGKMKRHYYNSVTASFGWQAGAQSYGYAVFLMNQDAVNYIRDSDGWEIGVGPTVAIVDQGVAKNLSTSSLKEDAYAFIFDQQGLMASLSIEGTKISRIKAP